MLIAKVDKIIELRKARGLNQKKLSEKAGLGKSYFGIYYSEFG